MTKDLGIGPGVQAGRQNSSVWHGQNKPLGRLVVAWWALGGRLVAAWPLISKTISKRGRFGRLEMPQLRELQGLRIGRNHQQLRHQTGEGPMAGLAVPIQWSTMCQLSSINMGRTKFI